jgi:hypothetical protein
MRVAIASGVVAGLALLLHAARAFAGGAPRVFVVDDGERLRKFDVDSPLAAGVDNAVWAPGAPIRVAALRDEVVALQVIVQAGSEALGDVTVEIDGLESPCGLVVNRFTEHYVNVTRRSSNVDRPMESLGWRPAAGPRDEDQLGWIPDALIPVEAQPQSSGRNHWRPYPLNVEPRSLAAVWVDVTVPRAAAVGSCAGSVVVRVGDRELWRTALQVEVRAAVLPYRAVSFLAYYALGELTGRMGAHAGLESSLWQLLHAHHVDALGNLESVSDVERLRAALDGSLYTEEHGYHGPGVGVAPAAVALGTYGGLGAPSASTIDAALGIVRRVPAAVEDVFLYAADEDCDSPIGPAWRHVVQRTPALQRLRIAHTCAREPRKQDVDLVLLPAAAFDSGEARIARALGQDVWVYNGALPHSGSGLLDAGASSLLVNGWIAAAHATGRWFLWESTFWNDDNRGGRGPVDPFATLETFHNDQGDTALGDGLLVYPGAQDATFPVHSLGRETVVPSIRLKSLRRGIQDAGYFALARSRAPSRADAVIDRLIPRCLDEAPEDRGPAWSGRGSAFAAARASLRDLIAPEQAVTPVDVRGVLDEAALARSVRAPRVWHWPRWRTLGGLLLSPALGILAAKARRRYRRTAR